MHISTTPNHLHRRIRHTIRIIRLASRTFKAVVTQTGPSWFFMYISYILCTALLPHRFTSAIYITLTCPSTALLYKPSLMSFFKLSPIHDHRLKRNLKRPWVCDGDLESPWRRPCAAGICMDRGCVVRVGMRGVRGCGSLPC